MSKSFWSDKKVVVTGGAGFLGRHLVKKLQQLNPRQIFIPLSSKYDLRDYNQCLKAFKGRNIVIHLAANVGGIGYNQSFPADLFDDNILIGVNCLRAARAAKINKFVTVGTVCSYPKLAPVPFKEKYLWQGFPEETNAPYGIAKLAGLVQAQAYRQQHNFNSIYLLQVNLYGPGDNFDLKSSHVIPALIRKFINAKQKDLPSVTIWGSGKATREFLFVKDAAEGILLAAEKYNKPEPINLGTGKEISIKSLAEKIKNIAQYQGKIVWDRSKPDGQPRRSLDISRAKKEFNFKANTNLDQGLRQTINWYLKHQS